MGGRLSRRGSRWFRLLLQCPLLSPFLGEVLGPQFGQLLPDVLGFLGQLADLAALDFVGQERLDNLSLFGGDDLYLGR